jgi:tetratricopeptide (TPR) repeat protein
MRQVRQARRLVLLGPVLIACAFGLPGQTDATEEILKSAIGLHQAGDINGAIVNYQKYLALRPESPMALSNLGAAYAKVGRYQDAIVQYRHALKLQPGNTPVELNLALAFYKTGQTEQAAATLEKVHRAAPDERQPTLLLADCWLAMGENKKVVALLTPLAERRPTDLAVAYQLGMALVRDQQPERGQVLIDRILRNGDSAQTWLLLGVTKLNAQDYPAALEDLTKAVALDPKLADVYSYYGQALLRTGDPVAAIDAFRKALTANPYDYSANLQLAVLLKDDEKLTEALECLRRALQVRPNDLGARYQLAGIAVHEGKLEAARRDLEAIVKETPAFTEAHVTLATVYYRLNRKLDGDRERAAVQKLNAEAQKKQQQGVNVK